MRYEEQSLIDKLRCDIKNANKECADRRCLIVKLRSKILELEERIFYLKQ